MRKKIQRILNIIMGSLAGVFLGSVLYKYWHFQKYPDFYVVQSAPWYTGILIQGLFTLVLLAVCLIIKAVLIENIGVKEALDIKVADASFIMPKRLQGANISNMILKRVEKLK